MRTTWVVLLLLAAAGCVNKGAGLGGSENIARAPENASLGGIPIALDGEVWRNQMPGPTENDPGLLVTVRVRTADNSPMPASIHADSAWVVNGPRIWATALSPVSRDPLGTSFEATAQRGPKWDPGETVDIVAVVRDGLNNRILVRASDKTIETAQ